ACAAVVDALEIGQTTSTTGCSVWGGLRHSADRAAFSAGAAHGSWLLIAGESTQNVHFAFARSARSRPGMHSSAAKHREAPPTPSRRYRTRASGRWARGSRHAAVDDRDLGHR